MIAYFDTSAIIAILLAETGGATAREAWTAARARVSTPLLYAEARAALALGRRTGRLDRAAVGLAVASLHDMYARLDQHVVDERLAARAGVLADGLDLRGFDAVHLAAAERVHPAGGVLVSGDLRLLAAAGTLGISTITTSAA